MQLAKKLEQIKSEYFNLSGIFKKKRRRWDKENKIGRKNSKKINSKVEKIDSNLIFIFSSSCAS